MVTIRAARVSDAGSMSRVHQSAVAAIPSGYYTAEELAAWSEPKSTENYERLIQSREFVVAEDDDVIVGFGVLDKQSGLIEAVFVSGEAGGRGIGLLLMERLERSARELGLRSLHLNASLNAVKFYERAGYNARERSRYRLQNGVEIDCVPMTKSV